MKTPDDEPLGQVLGGESALYIASDSDNRTALEPIIKAFPQVWPSSHGLNLLRGLALQTVCRHPKR